MRPTLLLAALVLVPTLALTTGCGGTTVTRVDENTDVDLSGNWNAGDSRRVADKMIADCISFPWADQFKAKHNRIPTVKTGTIKVITNGDVVNTEIFTNDLQRALLRSGKAQPVASNSEKDQAREERKDQDVNASEATRKESFQETGADFLIIGTINVQDDQAGGKRHKFYSVDLKMTDVKTQQQVWIGNEKISKVIQR
jgi:penicillin-binding protein activator